jgi:hypothetical protein
MHITLFNIFLISFCVTMFIVILGFIIYHYAIVNMNYNYNSNILWLNGVIKAGLPYQYEEYPPPDLPN